MNRFIAPIFGWFILLCAVPLLQGQQIYLKEGNVVNAKGVTRQGSKITAQIEVPGAGPGTISYEVFQIARITFPEPAGIAKATELAVAGKPKDALAVIDPVLLEQSGFKEIQGNWWLKAAQVKLSVLSALNDDLESEILIRDITASNTDPETTLCTRVRRVAALNRHGSHKEAVDQCTEIIKIAKTDAVLADAWSTKGDALFQMGEFEEALVALLHVTIFYADEKIIMPTTLLTIARCYNAIDDHGNAKETLDELLKDYPASPQAADAQIEMKKTKKTH